MTRFILRLFVVLVLGAPGAAFAHPDGTYPRTMNLDWSNSPDVVRNAKYDIVSLSARATAAKFDSIKALNPSSLRLVCPAWYTFYYAGPSGYAQTYGPFQTTDPTYGFDRKFWDMLNDNNWWCWGVDSAGTRWHATAFYNMWLGNFSTNCPTNAQGKRLCDVFGDFVCDELVAAKGADGVFFDQFWDGPSWLNGNMGGGSTPGTFAKSWFDLDGNYVADNPDSADAAWKAGIEIVVHRIRQRMGANFVIMGNAQHHYLEANGAMHERFPRLFGNVDPAPNPYNYKWQWAMFGPNGYLSTWPTLFSAPRRNLIDSEFSGGTQTQFPVSPAHQQLFRFNLGSTLLGDGYISLNSGVYNCTYWQPEYDLQLGWPVGVAYSQVIAGVTVWRRDFTKGEAWVNPTGVAVPAGANTPAIPAWDAVIRQTSGTIGTDPPAPVSAIQFELPRPNPMASDGSTLSFTLAAGEQASLVVLDLKGRSVRHVWTGVGTGDTQVAVWDGKSDEGWVAPAGVYFARVEGEAGRSSQQKLIRAQ